MGIDMSKETIEFDDGSVYNGELNQDGQFHGNGDMDWGNGAKYSGKWENDKMTGWGKYTFMDGKIHIGIFKDGLPNGAGLENYRNGDIYDGDFKNGARHGKGIMKYPDGAYYKGTFENGLPVGIGTEVFNNGDKYVGEYKDGVGHGKGTMTFGDGRDKLEGIWENGDFVGTIIE